MHPAQGGDTVVPRHSRCLNCSEGPSLTVWNNRNNSISPDPPPVHMLHTHSVMAADSKCFLVHVMQDGRYLWQPIIPSDQRGSVSKPEIVYLLGEELCCQLLWENRRWVVRSGTVVLSLTLTPHQPDSTSSSSPIVSSSEAKSAFQGNAIWLIYCWLRACHMAFREG